jgi:hypothetical protein
MASLAELQAQLVVDNRPVMIKPARFDSTPLWREMVREQNPGFRVVFIGLSAEASTAFMPTERERKEYLRSAHERETRKGRQAGAEQLHRIKRMVQSWGCYNERRVH